MPERLAVNNECLERSSLERIVVAYALGVGNIGALLWQPIRRCRALYKKQAVQPYRNTLPIEGKMLYGMTCRRCDLDERLLFQSLE